MKPAQVGMASVNLVLRTEAGQIILTTPETYEDLFFNPATQGLLQTSDILEEDGGRRIDLARTFATPFYSVTPRGWLPLPAVIEEG